MRSAFAPMVVGVGPATALSWVCVAGLSAFNCVKGPVFPDGLSLRSGTELTSTPLPGGGRAAFSTTQVLTSSTRFLQSSLESEPASEFLAGQPRTERELARRRTHRSFGRPMHATDFNSVCRSPCECECRASIELPGGAAFSGAEAERRGAGRSVHAEHTQRLGDAVVNLR